MNQLLGRKAFLTDVKLAASVFTECAAGILGSPFAIAPDDGVPDEIWIRMWRSLLLGESVASRDLRSHHRSRRSTRTHSRELKSIEWLSYDGEQLPVEHQAAFQTAAAIFTAKKISRLQEIGVELYRRARGKVRHIDHSWVSGDHYRLEVVGDESFILASKRSPTEREGEMIAVHFDASRQRLEMTGTPETDGRVRVEELDGLIREALASRRSVR